MSVRKGQFTKKSDAIILIESNSVINFKHYHRTKSGSHEILMLDNNHKKLGRLRYDTWQKLKLIYSLSAEYQQLNL